MSKAFHDSTTLSQTVSESMKQNKKQHWIIAFSRKGKHKQAKPSQPQKEHTQAKKSQAENQQLKPTDALSWYNWRSLFYKSVAKMLFLLWA